MRAVKIPACSGVILLRLVENGSLMAGQSVAFAKKIQPVAEIIEELVAGAERKLEEMISGSREDIEDGRPPSFRPRLPIN